MIYCLCRNKYDSTLISKVKAQTGSSKLKKIIKNLKNLEIEDLKEFSELRVKIFIEEKKEEKNIETKIINPII